MGSLRTGSTELWCDIPTQEKMVTLQNVMFVPDPIAAVAAGLISVSKVTKVALVLYQKNGNCEFEIDERESL